MNKDIKVGEGIPEYIKIKNLGLTNNSSLFNFFKHESLFNKIKLIPSFFKYCYQRLKYGVCEYDSFDTYYYFQTVLENGLKMLNNGRWGHPYGMTDEEWDSYLKGLIKKLEFVNSEECDGPYTIYEKAIEKYGYGSEEARKVSKEWLDYSLKFEEKQHEEMMFVLDELKEHWENLWD